VNYQFAHRDGESDFAIKNAVVNWNVIGTQDMTKEEMDSFCGDACRLIGHPYEGGVPIATFTGTENELAEAFERVGGGKWQFVEPDSEVRVLPEVTPYADTWGLNMIGKDTAPNKGNGANIYVADTGIRVSHTDFGGRAKRGVDITTGVVRVCNPADQTCAADNAGHGTHCAGTTAGLKYGVAPEATVWSIKVLSDSGSGSFAWSNSGLDWVSKSGARPAVVSMSLGGRGVVSSIRVSVQAVTNAGVVVVVAAGNENNNACLFSPAYVPEAITVGSTDSLNKRSSFSNYGTCVNIWAPGSAILSAAHTSDTGTATFSGTSMACPHVSGAVALVLSMNKDAGTKTLSKLLASSKVGKITGLMANDTNKFLCVGGCPVPLSG